jgi:long-chain acyl-CoA synthetase
MKKPHRLFDCLTELMNDSPDAAMLAAKENGAWHHYSVREVAEIVNKLSAGLIALGAGGKDMAIETRPKIALIAKNRPEWMFLDLAVQKAGAVLVPVYPTVHVNDLRFVLKDAAVKLVFVNDKDLLAKVEEAKRDAPSVESIYSFDKIDGCKHWTEILSLGGQHDHDLIKEIDDNINSEDLFTIIYTSGTTGTPKGVMLSHHNVLSNVLSCLPYLPVGKGTRVLSFLPLNHIFERMVTYVYLFAGVTIYYAESLDNLGDNLKEVKPRMFTTVPRLLEKVYEKILAKANEKSAIEKKIFYWALGLAEKFDLKNPGSLAYRTKLAIANKIVFKKWRDGLGGSLDCIVTGAAACPVKMIRIFTAAQITILEGYGQTESSPVICVNRMEPENRMFGTVGPVIDGVEVRIAADGEILCKGPNVMMGYYKREDLTLDTVKDGWLYTGDIGVLVDNKFLKITDRKKEIFKTSGGKYVAPQPIENKMAESPFISQVMVVGADEKFAGALIVPNFTALNEWCKQQSIDCSDKKQMLKDPRVHEKFKKIVDEFNVNFNQYEQVKKFCLLPEEWSVDGGELTPTLKLKRKVIMDKCAGSVNEIYRSLSS